MMYPKSGPGAKRNITSPKDMGIILETIINTDEISQDLKDEMLDILKRQQKKW